MYKKFIVFDKNGFSLIEILVVVAIIASIYSLILPNLITDSGVSENNKLEVLSADISGLIDSSILANSYHRIEFKKNGEYILSKTESEYIDPNVMQSEDDLTLLQERFEEYKILAGDDIELEGDKKIKRKTPVLVSFEKILKRPDWQIIKKRKLSPELTINDLHLKRLGGTVKLEDKDSVSVYIKPNGNIERTLINFSGKKTDYSLHISDNKSYLGIVEIKSKKKN